MGWKEWPYWLKGGILGSIISLLILFFLFVARDILPDSLNGKLDNAFIVLYLPTSLLLILIALSMGAYESVNPLFWPIYYVLIALHGFIIGAVIGLIYGKIKNRNK